MAKRFKLGICRVMTSTLHSCRSKDPSNLPLNPIPPTLISNDEPADHYKEWHVVAKIYGPRRKIYNSSDDLPQPLNKNRATKEMRLKKMIACSSWVDGKVRESYALVKRSKDPYQDFKDSMMDMILEKQMFHTKDLEQLLHCFLSLNSSHYHGVIVQAFSEIWESIFFSSDFAAYHHRPGVHYS